MRVVSLVPSLTAALEDLGAEASVVGRTTYCPPRPGVPAVGGTKNPDLAAIRALAPDLVLAVKEENRREDVEALRAAGLAVEVFDPETVADAPPLARALGRIGGVEAAGERMAGEIAAAIEAARAAAPVPIPTIYLIWREPYLAAGPETWIGSVLDLAGFPPVVAGRYPEVTPEALATGPAALILLSSEPFPFREKHAEELRATLEERTPVALCRGDLIGWYPSRLPAALEHLAGIRRALAKGAI
jgi:ABC-type Fe3+-hydroxamate transport system substrate-binding protein